MSRTAPAVFTIPLGESFVDALAAGLLAETGPDPAALGDMLVLLPNRRACSSLREAFLRAGNGRPLLLPRIQPLGEIDEDEQIAAEPAGFGAFLEELPPAIPPLRRRLALTALVQKWGEARDEPMAPAQAVRLAEELAALLDQLHTNGREIADLEHLVPADHAEHWQATIRFLHILSEAWPAFLDEQGAVDPARRRNLVLERLAAHWRETPPDHPVIAAGSTGSIPATRALLRVIARLPRGRVVLPGLDTGLEDDDLAAIRGDADAGTAPQETHAQHALLQTLGVIGADLAEVRRWPDGEGATATPRQHLARALMRPAGTSDKWAGDIAEGLPDAALSGIARADAPSPREEAELIALALRRALDEPARRAALVTPDRGLARRVAAALARWDIAVEDSAGMPLGGTPPGAFLRLTAELGADPAPLTLLETLQHPLALGGLEEGELRRLGRRLDLALRGRRAPGDLAGLIAQLEHIDPVPAEAIAVLRRLAELAGGFLDLPADAPFGARLEAHIGFAAALATDAEGDCRLWRGEDGEACAGLLDGLQTHGTDLARLGHGGLGGARAYAGLIDGLLALEPFRRRHAGHPRLAVLGPLEARLQHVDLVVIGGLNEGVWPPEVETGPWLSRPMRGELDLPQPEQRIGLAAHDFAGLLAAPDVLLTRARRAEGAPTVPSRWLARLAVLRKGDEALGDGPDWLALLARDQASPPRAPFPPAAFAPSDAQRPRNLSVSAIEHWLKDPYGFYARYGLRLKVLDPLDPQPEAAERGSLIHHVLAQFLARHPDRLPDDPVAELLALADAEFDKLGDVPAVRAFWRPHFARIATWFVAQERDRRAAGIAPLAQEHGGELDLAGIDGGFTIRARADRIDRLAEGTLEIIDYKTGALPGTGLVARGLRPQLALEGLIAREGGFPGIAGDVEALSYWRLNGGRSGSETRPGAGTAKDAPAAATLIENAGDGLRNLVAAYYGADPRQPYETGGGMDERYDDYALLARRAETAEED